jgi:hypothetical protein
MLQTYRNHDFHSTKVDWNGEETANSVLWETRNASNTANASAFPSSLHVVVQKGIALKQNEILPAWYRHRREIAK